jgi:Fe-S cluster assembly protein SufD
MTATLSPTDWIAPWRKADDLPGSDLPWLDAMREAAASRFESLGTPRRRWESWRYTDVAPIVKTTFEPARGGTPARGEVEAALARLPGNGRFHRLVFVDGVLVEPLSVFHELPEGLRVLSFSDALTQIPELLEQHLGKMALYEDNPFTALTAAFARDGVVVHVPKGVVVDRPIEAIWLTTVGAQAIANHARNLLVAEESSEVTLLDVFHAAHNGTYLNNITTEIVAGPNASVTHIRIQEEGRSAFHVADTKIRQERDSRVCSYVITTGGRSSRNELGFALSEPGASCVLNGLFVLNGNQVADNMTLVDHQSPHCTSSEFYKGVMDGQSEGAFTGRVLVREDAQKTDAEQNNRNLLLSDDAQVNTRPQLEIYADDVKCAHGATSGQLDRSAMFYLRTRGIDEIRARQILTRAFASEIIGGIPVQEVRNHLLPVVEDRLCPGHTLEKTP